MSTKKLISDLIPDIIPRLKTAAPGFTIYGAVNSITSLIYKTLLDHRSDMVATGDMETIIPSSTVVCPLPDYFSAFAERPKVMNGVDGFVGTLITELAAAGVTAPKIATITGMLASPTLIQDIQAIAVVDVPGINVKAMAYALLDTDQDRRHLDPSYLDEDKEHDDIWWDSYNYQGYSISGSDCGGRYKVIGANVYVRPKSDNDQIMKGRYYQKPLAVSGPSDILQYSDLSYEVYKEGVVLIMVKGLAIPESDPVFAGLMQREIMTEVNARTCVTSRRRTRARDWM